MNGFFLVDKPGGITSHDVVSRARRLLGIKKIGHAGTLDPMATGLLILAVGRFTRLIRYVQDRDKEYVARVQFGVATDTLDTDGAVLSRTPMSVTQGDVEGVLPRFQGTIHQVPPMVSALKVGGRRLYDIAREGETVERAPRPVTILGVDLEEFVPGPYPEAVIRVRCGKGTYIRSLAADIASALGGQAALSELRRTGNGDLTVDSAVELESWEAMEDPWGAACTPTDVLGHMPVIEVDDETARAVSNGVRLLPAALGAVDLTGTHALVSAAGILLAVYELDERQAVPQVVVA